MTRNIILKVLQKTHPVLTQVPFAENQGFQHDPFGVRVVDDRGFSIRPPKTISALPRNNFKNFLLTGLPENAFSVIIFLLPEKMAPPGSRCFRLGRIGSRLRRPVQYFFEDHPGDHVGRFDAFAAHGTGCERSPCGQRIVRCVVGVAQLHIF